METNELEPLMHHFEPGDANEARLGKLVEDCMDIRDKIFTWAPFVKSAMGYSSNATLASQAALKNLSTGFEDRALVLKVGEVGGRSLFSRCSVFSCIHSAIFKVIPKGHWHLEILIGTALAENNILLLLLRLLLLLQYGVSLSVDYNYAVLVLVDNSF